MDEPEIQIERIEPEPFPDGEAEMHPDGGGATIYRTMTPVEVAAMMGRYNAERGDA